MTKTFKFTAQPWPLGDGSVSIDFKTSSEIIAPKSFGVTSVRSFTNTNPLLIKNLSEYDGGGFIYKGGIAINRVGTVTKVGASFDASYTETVDLSKTMIKSIAQDDFPFDSPMTVTFSSAVKYSAIAGKKLGALIADGDKFYGTGGGDKFLMTDRSEIVFGEAGDDRIEGRGGNDTLKGGAGNDTLYGGAGGDMLEGGSGNDVLKGAAGKDTIYGGAGADKLYGGSEADTFVFRSIADSKVATSGRDMIYDFSRSEGDKIDLKAIDANKDAANDQAFKFIGDDAFSKKAGQLRFEKKGGDTFIHGDINGDAVADFTIVIDASLTLKATDFIL